MTPLLHPTKSKLIETAVALLDTKLPSEISVDEILEVSGISKGSLYHHFEDLSEVLEQAQVFRYARWVDRSIEAIVSLISTVKSKDDVFDAVTKLSELTQSSSYRNYRFERARTIANSSISPRFARALAIEQKRLTDALEDEIREVQEKGFYRKDLNPRVAAVFIQSYTLGKIVDDIVDEPVKIEEWNEFINFMIKASMFD